MQHEVIIYAPDGTRVSAMDEIATQLVPTIWPVSEFGKTKIFHAYISRTSRPFLTSNREDMRGRDVITSALELIINDPRHKEVIPADVWQRAQARRDRHAQLMCEAFDVDVIADHRSIVQAMDQFLRNHIPANA